MDFEIKKLLSHLSFQKQIDNAKALLMQSEHDFGKISAIYACQLLDNLTCCKPLFRPHWLLDNGDKIYADEVDIIDKDWYSFDIGNNFNDYQDYHPLQYKNKESDFGVLFKDGSHMWARWIGEDND
jgi:hypothetical protein